MYKVLGAESCFGRDKQQPALESAAANQNPLSKDPASSFTESFISSAKQGGGATVLGRGYIVTRGTCVPTSFSEHEQLRRSSCAAFCLLLSSAAGAVPNSACH
jgi:hypothetical protein